MKQQIIEWTAVIVMGVIFAAMFVFGAQAQPVAGTPYLDGQPAPVITCVTNNGVVFVYQGYNCPQGSVKK
jgi:hypothetical protein